MAGEDEPAAGATPAVMTSSLFEQGATPNSHPNPRNDDATRTHAVYVFLYLQDSEARNRNCACRRVSEEVTLWMIFAEVCWRVKIPVGSG